LLASIKDIFAPGIKMKHTLTDLNEYLFQQLDALSNGDLSGEALDKEIERSKAIQGIAKTVIDSANVALKAKKHMDEYGGGSNVEIPMLGIVNK
jgi:hypothetical protein